VRRLPHLLLGLFSALLPLLAYLQYQWIGRLSEAERERMQAGLRANLNRFRQDFDGELTRLFFAFQSGPPPVPQRTLDDYAERLRRWHEVARDPELLRAVYAADGENLQVLDFHDLQWRAAEWPASLAGLRSRPLVEGDAPALILPRYPGGFLLLELDLDFLRTRALPDLVQEHFAPAGYQIQVRTRSAPGRVIYQSDAAADFSSPDATTPLFEILPEPLGGPRGPRFGLPGPPPVPPRGAAGGRWLLAARHRSGSLEAVVRRARLRNLSISFAVLLLMGATMALLVVSTRRAHRLAQLQLEFIAGVSHELRTPLAVITSAADNLADGLVAGPEQAQRYGAAIRKESRRLGGMVEQVLAFAGAGSGRLRVNPEPTAVATVVSRALAACESDAQEAQCRLETQLPADLPSVLADPTALAHCIQNLVLNALKHGRAGGWVGIHAASNGAAVQISVEDRGPGVDPADLPHLFEPFYRGRRALALQIRGTGLGLSLVRRMMEAQSGSVTVRSTPGQGACFTLTIPVAPPHEAPPPAG
jgi:signal transduction histidine kinase